MKPGTLSKRIRIMKERATADGMGGRDVAWVLHREVWAEVRPLNGREMEWAMQYAPKVNFKITTRYFADVTPGMVVDYGHDRLHIHAVIDNKEQHIQLEMLCEALVDG